MNVFGLIGHPLTHSFSKKYFDKKFEQENIQNAQFSLFDIEKIELVQNLIQDDSIKGFAVTIPYKQQILPFLFSINDAVKKINACNCVKVIEGKLYGFNTDFIGFEQSFIKDLKPFHQKALILGNGGAAASIKFVLNKLKIDYSIVNRTKSKHCITYDELTDDLISSHQIIINTTPLGTFPLEDTCPDIPYHYLSSKHYLFDLVYNPSETLFMKKGLAQKAFVKNGYEMLCLQAEENWKIWNS
ncbi:MAG: shikimate dehydrogenase [Chitinophagaceae bacterium]|nr:shikimate dehydrogenase [Chitinophagaceae bacterium]